MEDQPLRRSRRLQNLTPLTTVDPPPPPLRYTVKKGGSFESTGISENLGEPELRYIQPELLSLEIEDLEAKEFVRNYNSPLTDLGDEVLV